MLLDVAIHPQFEWYWMSVFIVNTEQRTRWRMLCSTRQWRIPAISKCRLNRIPNSTRIFKIVRYARARTIKSTAHAERRTWLTIRTCRVRDPIFRIVRVLLRRWFGWRRAIVHHGSFACGAFEMHQSANECAQAHNSISFNGIHRVAHSGKLIARDHMRNYVSNQLSPSAFGWRAFTPRIHSFISFFVGWCHSLHNALAHQRHIQLNVVCTPLEACSDAACMCCDDLCASQSNMCVTKIMIYKKDPNNGEIAATTTGNCSVNGAAARACLCLFYWFM